MDKPFPCDWCDRSFDTERGLKSHQRSKHPVEFLESKESGESSYICQWCGKSFTFDTGLIGHISESHPGKPAEAGPKKKKAEIQIPCEYCEKTFKSDRGLAQHLRAKHAEFYNNQQQELKAVVDTKNQELVRQGALYKAIIYGVAVSLLIILLVQAIPSSSGTTLEFYKSVDPVANTLKPGSVLFGPYQFKSPGKQCQITIKTNRSRYLSSRWVSGDVSLVEESTFKNSKGIPLSNWELKGLIAGKRQNNKVKIIETYSFPYEFWHDIDKSYDKLEKTVYVTPQDGKNYYFLVEYQTNYYGIKRIYNRTIRKYININKVYPVKNFKIKVTEKSGPVLFYIIALGILFPIFLYYILPWRTRWRIYSYSKSDEFFGGVFIIGGLCLVVGLIVLCIIFD
ncbi:MAG: C2H2-type zinc finger protein [Spirochaetota bacterium]|nr:C2H2-type zinc finger protein [Spirochaetota bacterium]